MQEAIEAVITDNIKFISHPLREEVLLNLGEVIQVKTLQEVMVAVEVASIRTTGGIIILIFAEVVFVAHIRSIRLLLSEAAPVIT